nr:hypothetical protein BaRGS_019045 [Batillaria attramentaria]
MALQKNDRDDSSFTVTQASGIYASSRSVYLLATKIRYLKQLVLHLFSDTQQLIAHVNDLKLRVTALENEQAPCPAGFPLRYGGSCYSISADTLNFENARFKFFIDSYWLGGSDQPPATDGQFVWVSDNRLITFTDWAQGEPSGGNENCLEIRVPFNSMWNDRNCNVQNRYICEISLI